MKRNYAQTIEWLYAKLPMFTRIGAAAIKKDLTNTRALCEILGHPERRFLSIHLAGTNGKGSVSHMLAALFQKAGWKTGLYTSPHLYDFRERIRINGEVIPEEKVIDWVAQTEEHIERIAPSFFEVTVGMAFSYFAENEVDIAIIETGLGGRLDSTNVIQPILSIITNIGWDHMDLLGHTLPAIAAEKAGIIKRQTPVLVGEVLPETKPVFLDKATLEDAPIFFAENLWSEIETEESANFPGILNTTWREIEAIKDIEPKSTYAVNPTLQDLKISCDLSGWYQKKNIRTVLSAWSILRNLIFSEQHAWWETYGIALPAFKQLPSIYDSRFNEAFSLVKKSTGLMGRWEVLQTAPLVVNDVAHNEDGMKQVIDQLRRTDYAHLHVVTGVVKDKDVDKILLLLPSDATFYFTNAQIPRALPAAELKQKAAMLGKIGEAFSTVNEAIQSALGSAASKDLILICGSVFIAGEIDRSIFSLPST